MMQKMRIKFISDGFREILLSDGVKNLVDDIGEQIKDKANARLAEDSTGYEKETRQIDYRGGRWQSAVYTTDMASMKAEAEYNALSGAVT